MKLIDRLLKKARKLIQELFVMDDDDFIKALGLDPKNYPIVKNGDIVGYDFIAALKDGCDDIWTE
ncbi:MAG: hypothetical protein K0S71_644 [Clostridia bacterium]|jgi:hypothetical protein|nr:hypothetical protein [Clostridia bacterium]